MKTPLSEIIDRYSILLLKKERLSDDQLTISLLKEIDVYKAEIPNLYLNYVQKLYEINGQIWDLESDIRKGKEKELGLEEVGKRTLQIRDLNKKRISIKNEIVFESNEGYIDVKMNHASE
jgi:hypothetical protein